ncbi:MAG: hypothetical protein MUF87_17675 [Anaerolineae bacterium]|nr:hypothetical protein [Anaerolineae bacterium]
MAQLLDQTSDLFRVSFTPLSTWRNRVCQKFFSSCQLSLSYQPRYADATTTTFNPSGGNYPHAPLSDPNNPPYSAVATATDDHTHGGGNESLFNITNFFTLSFEITILADHFS